MALRRVRSGWGGFGSISSALTFWASCDVVQGTVGERSMSQSCWSRALRCAGSSGGDELVFEVLHARGRRFQPLPARWDMRVMITGQPLRSSGRRETDRRWCGWYRSGDRCGGGDRALPEVHGGSQELEAVCSSMTVCRLDDDG